MRGLTKRTCKKHIATCFHNATRAKSDFEWYVRAHLLAESLCADVEKSAGILAALSPGVRWERNIIDAKSLILSDGSGITTYPAQKKKAQAILFGANPREILRGPKERAFFECILDPQNDSWLCLDRHAGRIALPSASLHVVQRVLQTKGRRVIVAAYCAVAEEYGLTPCALQSGTWDYYRNNRRTK